MAPGIEADPKHYHVEYENDRVRVVRVKYAPGERSLMHTHPASVHVFLTNGRVRVTGPNGKREDVNVKAGSTWVADRLEHLPENIGKEPIEAVQIELKK